ncbi:MAG: hypothetical protein WD200_00945 [Candidatus Andersenbacteria bacterium]
MQKRWIRLIIIALLVLLTTLGAWWFFSRSSDIPDEDGLSFFQFPTPGDRTDPFEQEESPTADDTSSSDTQPPQSTDNIAVTVRYQRGDSFSLSITEATYSPNQPTIAQYTPPGDSPYSQVQLLDASGSVISEYRFAISTRGILEGPNIQHQTLDLPESTAYLILPSPQKQATHVRIMGANGQEFDRQALPDIPITSLPNNPLAWLRQLVPANVWAQSGSDSRFTIVVINETTVSPSSVDPVIVVTRGILGIDPWRMFAGQVDVVPIYNQSTLLGCNVGSGQPISCKDDAHVMKTVAKEVPDWDAILVVTNLDCNDCGYVGETFPPIAVVGTAATVNLIVHELGHAIGKLLDEYLYQHADFPDQQPRYTGPNCFKTIDECRAALEPYLGDPHGECAAGCNGGSNVTFRPATRIMHNTFIPLVFGPVERCIMGKAIAKGIGRTYECTPQTSPVPDPTPTNTPGTYWGWYR